MPSHFISNRLLLDLVHPDLLEFIRDDQSQIIDGTPGFPVIGGAVIRNPMGVLNPGQTAKLDFWKQRVEAAGKVIAVVHASVGAIMRDVPGGACSGTAFAVGPQLIMTNWHVADNVFSLPAGDAGMLDPPQVISFPHFLSFSENGGSDPKFPLLRVLAASVRLDYALVAVGGGADEFPAGLHLAAAPEKLKKELPTGFMDLTPAGRPLHIIRRIGPPEPLPDYPWAFGVGYPDSIPFDMDAETGFVFNGRNGAKAILPGMILGLRECPLKGEMENLVVFESTYSSLPNCSGMPVCRSDSGTVVGLHFDGQAALGNYAVPSWTIVEDLRAKLGHTPEGLKILSDMRM